MVCASLLAASTTAIAQEGGITVSEVRAQAFLERSGEDATCAPLEIDVKIGRSRRTETLDLQCDAPPPAEDAAGAGGKDGRRKR